MLFRAGEWQSFRLHNILEKRIVCDPLEAFVEDRLGEGDQAGHVVAALAERGRRADAAHLPWRALMHPVFDTAQEHRQFGASCAVVDVDFIEYKESPKLRRRAIEEGAVGRAE